MRRADTRLHTRIRGTSPCALDHLRRPIGGNDLMASFCEFERIDASATTQVEQSRFGLQLTVHGIPHGEPHALDQLVITSWTVIVGGYAVKSVLCLE